MYLKILASILGIIVGIVQFSIINISIIYVKKCKNPIAVILDISQMIFGAVFLIIFAVISLNLMLYAAIASVFSIIILSFAYCIKKK